MKTTLRLIFGEIKRLITYKIIPVSIATMAIWVVIFLMVSSQEALELAPLLIFVDVGMMMILLIGASFHLEKQEGTIKSMMVMPVSLTQIFSAKLGASLVLAIESIVVVSVSLYFIHGITFNYPVLLLFILIAGAVHATLGFLLSLISKDFTSLLGWIMAYIFPFMIPSILFTFGIIDKKYEWLLMLSPSHSASNLIAVAISGEFNMGKILVASLYLVALTVLLCKYVVYPKFKDSAVRG
ncbi:UNVERIFIED_CONTAM: fluoroquinolone transport system permease protein [Acetivibrio alkalicellulosi]